MVEKMKMFKKVFAGLLTVLIFSASGAGQAQAADIAASVGGDWIRTQWTSGQTGTAIEDRFTLTNGAGVTLQVTDGFTVGDSFRISNNGVVLGDTSAPVGNGDLGGETGDTAFAIAGYSKGSFSLGAGAALISLTAQLNCCQGGGLFVRFVSQNIKNTADALRLDALGATNEKNNVVSCTPGKYTFLNGGSTPETAKIQSYVYTLLVNGKAVSTLSSDGFKSVASHLFPTIAGNMAGTTTLEGASWNLAGMSNYSAQCQVYATQSGGNIQSATTAANDSVALAAAAAEAAKVQMAKDMIANWASSNEALAKKSRDARLAGKP